MKILLLFFLGTWFGCQSNAKTPEARGSESLRHIGGTVPFTRKPPANAKVVDGVASVILFQGFGKIQPEPGRGLIVVVAFVAYDNAGRVTSETPVMFHEFDGSKPEWKAVLGQMVAGEVRRMWIPDGERMKVYDVRLRALGESPKR